VGVVTCKFSHAKPNIMKYSYISLKAYPITRVINPPQWFSCLTQFDHQGLIQRVFVLTF
jgi:hypothetical protein